MTGGPQIRGLHEPAKRFILTTNPGIEDIAGEELRERWAEAGLEPEGLQVERSGARGQVAARADCSAQRFLEVARRMRSIYHVLLQLARFPLEEAEPLESIRRALRALEIPGMREAASFRVTCNRSGEHPFSSLDVQREAGAALQQRYGTPVDLEGYELDVRVDLQGRDCQVRLQLTRDGLDRRFRRVYQPRVTLKATVAYAMLRLARLGPQTRRLLDPFCGSGTILLEAARIHPDLEVVGGDRDPRAVEGARRNAAAAGLAERIEVRLMDARDLAARYPPGRFGAIVTDPPFGVRQGRGIDYTDLYRKFLDGARRVLAPEGRLVLLVGKRRRLFTRALFELGGFAIRHVRNIETSGVYPMVFVLQKV